MRAALLSLPAFVAAKELPKDETKAAKLYDSGIKHMNNIALKMVRFAVLLNFLVPTNIYRKRLQGKKPLVHMPPSSTPKLRISSHAPTEPPSQVVTLSGART